MYIVDLYFRVRKVCLVEGMSVREELISEVVEIEKSQVRERAYPPGITNRR